MIRIMKKIITLVALMATMWAAMPASAQSLKFGVKGGLNVSSLSLSKDLYASDNQTGFYVGPTMKIGLPLGFGLDLSALYDQRSVKVEADNEEATVNTFKQKQLSVPLNLRWGIGLGSLANVFVFAGPQVGFNLDKNVVKTMQSIKFKNSDFSVNVGLGLLLLKHLQVSANYNIACGKTCDVSSFSEVMGDVATSTVRGRYNTWQVGLAYYF